VRPFSATREAISAFVTDPPPDGLKSLQI